MLSILPQQMSLSFAMEEELKCPMCHKLFVDPVILPCTHNLCCQCAERLKSKNGTVCDLSSESFTRTGVDFDKISLRSEAVFSDADSGYSAGSLRSNSSDPGRTNSLSSINVNGNHQQQPPSPGTASPQTQGVHLPSLPESISCLTCPTCQRTVFLDDRGVNGLTQNTLMLNIIKKYESRNDAVEGPPTYMTKNSANWHYRASGHHHSQDDRPTTQVHVPQRQESKSPSVNLAKHPLNCEMCEISVPQAASVKCEQCKVRYCSPCQRRFHPVRGPLASHNLIRLKPGSDVVRSSSDASLASQDPVNAASMERSRSVPNGGESAICEPNGLKCSFHVMENMSMYCEKCLVPLCYQCLEDGRHRSHDVKALGATCKAHKADLSRQMGSLSNKARQAKDLVMHLRAVQEEIQKNGIDFEARAVVQCNALVDAINHKKQELVQRVNAEKEVKQKIVREQLQQCTMKLKQTTGLLEYCIEVMKENNPAPFLQVSSGLIQRVSATEQQWTEHHLTPRTKSEFDFDLDAGPLMQAIEEFTVTHRRVPEKPSIKVAECASSNNTVTLSWGIHPTSSVEAFILELDDGARGLFRDVYHGKQTACTIDGLHFNSIYRARVSAYNKAGRSPCSDVVRLQTSEVAVFHMDSKLSHQDVNFTNNYQTVNCSSVENKVALANIGFSKGVHYWEYSVDRYESSNPDVVVGVSYARVDKGCILGKDRNAWSMYVDSSRIWFLHDDKHTNRCECGIDVGSRLGVLLDFDSQTVTFYVDQMQKGSPVSIAEELVDAKTNRPKTRVFFPAVSLNRQAQLTLWSGLRPPKRLRRGFDRSQSFTGTANSANANAFKNRVVGDHSISVNGNSTLRLSKVQSSPMLQSQNRSRSSGDLEGAKNENERLYHSLPPQLVVKKEIENVARTLERQLSFEHRDSEVVPSLKPALKRKPPQLMNGLQQTRRQQRSGSYKVPPPPPVRRGSSITSVNPTDDSVKSSDHAQTNNALQTF